jgi:hypothetical protein
VCGGGGEAGGGGCVMVADPGIDPAIGAWFKKYRESYEWPRGDRRERSEQKIFNLHSSVRIAISDKDVKALAESLIAIHRWKTNNRSNTTAKYNQSLSSKKAEYFIRIFNLGPFDTTEKILPLIRKLNIPYCNLPVCSAMASFIYYRKYAPIIDRFGAQFFAKEVRVEKDDETSRVLQYVKTIPFRCEDGGTGNLRLAVYSPTGFEDNLSKYINDFIPECNRIALELTQLNIKYCDVEGKLMEFFPVDVEMAIFSYATKHSSYF